MEGAHEFYAGDGALLIHNCDEIGSWRRVKESWEEGVEFSTRIGSARKILTGTPKRGHPLVKEFHDRGVSGDPDVTLIRGRTMDNAANLSDEFLRIIRAKYEGTTLGRQELDGLLLADAEGAVVTTDLIDVTRVRPEHLPELRRVVVALDPAVTSRATSDHTGIVVVGLGGPPLPGYLGRVAMVGGDHAYLLADESVRATPRDWAARALKVAEQWAADAVVAEVNNGGDLVTTMITLVADADGIPIPRLISVRAAVDKRTRAEPVAGMWEQHRVHVVGALPDVEDQFAGWTPGDRDSPDQLDACVTEGTPVLTERGAVPVESVRVGDRVRTRTGWQAVTWSGCTRAAAPVFEVRVESGAVLEATAEHRVWTARGWVRVDALLCTDIMLEWRSDESPLNGTGKSGRATPTPVIVPNGSTTSHCVDGSTCTSPYGKTVTDGWSPLVTMFITETVTRWTTALKIWSPCSRSNMRRLTANWAAIAGTALRSGWSIWPRSAHRLRRGTAPLRGGHGMSSMAATVGMGGRLVRDALVNSVRSCSPRCRTALGGAEKSVGSAGTTRIARTTSPRAVSTAVVSTCAASAPSGFVPARVVSVRVVKQPRRVYDLTVETDHEFVAGGLLVHNCVWGVVSLFPELGIGSATRVRVLNSGLYAVSRR